MKKLFKNLLKAFKREKYYVSLYNKICANDFGSVFYEKGLRAAVGRNFPSEWAIGDHICTIFADVVIQKPSFIVELGTRGGESTKALLAAAKYSQAKVLSIDIEPCGHIVLPKDLQKLWHFVQSDDVKFGRDQFEDWCKSNGLETKIDVLFIDSSHGYEHTIQEIDTWFRFVAVDGIVLFHDTSMARLYRKLNNKLAKGWSNERGVIRAIEEHFEEKFDENKVFVDIKSNWLIRHYPYSSGLILLKRLT